MQIWVGSRGPKPPGPAAHDACILLVLDQLHHHQGDEAAERGDGAGEADGHLQRTLAVEPHADHERENQHHQSDAAGHPVVVADLLRVVETGVEVPVGSPLRSFIDVGLGDLHELPCHDGLLARAGQFLGELGWALYPTRCSISPEN